LKTSWWWLAMTSDVGVATSAVKQTRRRRVESACSVGVDVVGTGADLRQTITCCSNTGIFVNGLRVV